MRFNAIFGLFLCSASVPPHPGDFVVDLHGKQCVLVQHELYTAISECFFIKNGIDFSLSTLSGHNPNNLKCLEKLPATINQWEEVL